MPTGQLILTIVASIVGALVLLPLLGYAILRIYRHKQKQTDQAAAAAEAERETCGAPVAVHLQSTSSDLDSTSPHGREYGDNFTPRGDPQVACAGADTASPGEVALAASSPGNEPASSTQDQEDAQPPEELPEPQAQLPEPPTDTRIDMPQPESSALEEPPAWPPENPAPENPPEDTSVRATSGPEADGAPLSELSDGFTRV